MNLAGNLVRFTRVLRTAGIPIGTDKVLDAVRVLPIAGLEHRADCHATLSALFLTRREQQPLFDEAFARFWAPPQVLEREQALKLPKVAGPLSRPPRPVAIRRNARSFMSMQRGHRISFGSIRRSFPK